MLDATELKPKLYLPFERSHEQNTWLCATLTGTYSRMLQRFAVLW